MSRRKTQAEFEQQVKDIFGDEYSVVGTYINSSHRVAIRHNKCGAVNMMFPSNVLRGATCIKCSDAVKGKKQRKSDKQYKKEVYDKVGNEYTVLTEYVKSGVKVTMRHNKCGYVWDIDPLSFLSGNRCPRCNGGVKKDPKKFAKEFEELMGGEYTLLSIYKNSNTKVKVQHSTCGHTYWVVPSSILAGRRCPYCFGHLRKTDEQFKQEVKELVGDEYTVLGKYVNNHTKITMIHNKCKQKFNMTPTDFIYNNHRCPWCSPSIGSHGNNMVLKALQKLGIKYLREKKFPGCIYKRELPFDFYLPDYNTCIEYDGKQHFLKDSFPFRTDPFEIRKKRDHIKDQFCKDNGIVLIRLSYDKYPTVNSIYNYLRITLNK